MDKARVLVIDGDDWVTSLLAGGLRDHGFYVDTCPSGDEALSRVTVDHPDCVVAEFVLPGIDGISVVRAIRSSKPPTSLLPVLMLTNSDDNASRCAAFQAGVDVFLTKPFRVNEVAMQVQGIISMANRLTGSTKAPIPTDDATCGHIREGSLAPSDNAIEGNIAQMSVATVLTLLEMERRSGLLTVSRKESRCSLDLVSGCAIRGTMGGQDSQPLAVLREIIHWREGRFLFRPGSDGAVPNGRWSIGALLLEAVRLDDELTKDSLLEPGAGARRSWPLATPIPIRASSLPFGRPSRPPPQRISRPSAPSALPPLPTDPAQIQPDNAHVLTPPRADVE